MRDPAVLEPPDHIGGGAEDDRPEKSLDSEQPQDERAAYLVIAADLRRLRGGPVARWLPGHERAAAQAAPGGSGGRRGAQLRTQGRLIGRVRHMPGASAGKQAPVHLRSLRQPGGSRRERDHYFLDRTLRGTAPGSTPVTHGKVTGTGSGYRQRLRGRAGSGGAISLRLDRLVAVTAGEWPGGHALTGRGGPRRWPGARRFGAGACPGAAAIVAIYRAAAAAAVRP